MRIQHCRFWAIAGTVLPAFSALSRASVRMVWRKLLCWSLQGLLWTGLWGVAHAQPRFYALGTLPGNTDSVANAVSDTAHVVGYCYDYSSPLVWRPFIWSPETGMRALPLPGSAVSATANAVSGDGSVVAGQAVVDRGYACYWDETGAYFVLDRPSMATGVSYDGRIIAGWGDINRVVPFVFDRVASRLEFLPEPQGSAGTNYVYCVSGDGRVLGGMAMMRNNYLYDPRFRGGLSARGHVWVDGVPQARALSGGGFGSQVNALSYDGTIAVGSADLRPIFSSVRQAVLWEGTAATVLGTLGGRNSNATGTDRYGRQVVGTSEVPDGGTRPFYWTPRLGMVSLQDRFSAIIPAGWTLISAGGISPNGRFIVGAGLNPQGRAEAWLIDTGGGYVAGDVNGNGCVDDADLLAVLFAFGNTGSGLDEDVNCDGTVDDADLLEVLFNFGNGC